MSENIDDVTGCVHGLVSGCRDCMIDRLTRELDEARAQRDGWHQKACEQAARATAAEAKVKVLAASATDETEARYALRARIAALEAQLTTRGACQCGEDEVCALAKRAQEAETRVAALEAQLAMQQVRTDLISRLRDLDVCEEGLAWIEQTPGGPDDLWAACPRGDWLLWLLEAVGYDDRTMRHIACDCAANTLPIYERAHPDDPRPRDCIAVARRYADGEATYDELIAARVAAWAAVNAAVDATAKGAAWVAALAAAGAASDAAAKNATWAAACAAAWAAANDAIWAASLTADSDEALAAAMSRHADMIRARVSWTDVERAMGVSHG